MESLADLKCVPCRGGEPPLSQEEIDKRMADVPGWQVKTVEGVKRLERVYKVKDFKEALALTNKVGEIAEQEGHHPRIVTEWGKVEVQWWTHKIKGLHPNDFIMAAKTERLGGGEER
jgi:4a-hydroxytetrahydrobiopterin dehydratase